MGLLITTYANLVNVWKTSGEAYKERKKRILVIITLLISLPSFF